MYLQNITKKFLKDNKDLIDKDDWGEILIKASELNSFPLNDIINLMKEFGRDTPRYSPYKIGDQVRILNYSYNFIREEDISKLKPLSAGSKSKTYLKQALEDIKYISNNMNLDFKLLRTTPVTILDIFSSKDMPFIYLIKYDNHLLLYPFNVFKRVED